MCQATSNNLFLMPQNTFFPRNRDFLVSPKMTETLFPHPPSPLQGNFATATVLAFVLLRNSRFNFHCYTQHEATPTQKSARKWHFDFSRLLARKITNGIHSSKPASLNRPTDLQFVQSDVQFVQLRVARTSFLIDLIYFQKMWIGGGGVSVFVRAA